MSFTPASVTMACHTSSTTTMPGGQARYSDLAIETALILRAVFRQPLRQTEGLVSSLFALMGLDLPVLDHSTLSGRAWRKLRLGVDVGSGTIIAAALTGKKVDDAAELRPSLDQVAEPVAAVIAERGRVSWQTSSGYNVRAGAEGAMSRCKRIIGDALQAHSRPAQRVETQIAVHVLSRMLALGCLESVRAA
ncbi:hypothetical protein FHW79_005948 [Azospirillum sp. OGB3]|uniref:transposase n=1 Tax=Azospirillum sp. OGB3 TaxID=2587012 RepID=UPI001605F9B4|nr:transposase [Azospirillum sp. OGB3]MBB3268273.1 hypothetical protein [Azospirillum sp. OGB3]